MTPDDAARSPCRSGSSRDPGGAKPGSGKIGARLKPLLQWTARLLPVLCLWLLIGPALAAPRIGVVTMKPGEIFWERFGHDAIIVFDPATGEATSYNFGLFDPTEPGFIGRFLRGEMRYRLGALPLTQDLAIYDYEGRGAELQWLNLSHGQATALAEALAINALPQNAAYSYDYFLDNCSTRVRDAVDAALGGALKRQLAGRTHGLSFRDEALRLASPAPWMWLGFDLGLGPAADRAMSVWEEAFVPARLAAALADAGTGGGASLVIDRQQLLPHRLAPPPVADPPRWWLWSLAGVVAAAALAWLGTRRPRAVAAVALPLWAFSGVLAALMLFIWFGTEHRFGWANHNLLLFSPLCWLLLPGGWRLLRGRAPGRLFRYLLLATATSAVLALPLHWLAAQPQDNLHWIGLMVPVHAALAWTFCRSGSNRPTRPEPAAATAVRG